METQEEIAPIDSAHLNWHGLIIQTAMEGSTGMQNVRTKESAIERLRNAIAFLDTKGKPAVANHALMIVPVTERVNT